MKSFESVVSDDLVAEQVSVVIMIFKLVDIQWLYGRAAVFGNLFQYFHNFGDKVPPRQRLRSIILFQLLAGADLLFFFTVNIQVARVNNLTLPLYESHKSGRDTHQ